MPENMSKANPAAQDTRVTTTDSGLAVGMSLAERRSCAAAPPSAEPSGTARSRAERWQSSFGSHEPGFASRLTVAGVDERQLLALLEDDAASLSARLVEVPDWMRFYQAALASNDNRAPVTFAIDDKLNFARVLQPLLEEARRRLTEQLNPAARSGLDQDLLADSLGRSLLPMLHAMLGRSVVLELNVARLAGNLPAGSSPEERFHAFLDRLSARAELRRFLEMRPVLARQICVALLNWVDSSVLLCTRLAADLPAIEKTFSADSALGAVAGIELGLGDRHAGGRTVARVTFGNGTQIVYKPRPVDVDVHFQELLTWANTQGFQFPLRTLAYLRRAGYGWAEHVAPHHVAAAADLPRFYRRQGGLLALLYLLDASDLHAENVIAAGDQPVLVDLETVFQPRLIAFPPGVLSSEQAADTASVTSVLRTGLLPTPSWQGATKIGVDLSGLGRQPGQVTPMPVPGFVDEGRDDMRIALAHREIEASDNRPVAGALDLADFAPDLLQGFQEMYRLLRQNATALASADGPLRAFRNDRVRVLRRSTVEYGALLATSLHPDLLSDGLDLDRHYDRLWRRTTLDPTMVPFVPSEHADLWNTDIPLFTVGVDDDRVFDSQNRPLAIRLDRTPLETVLAKLSQLDDGDLQRQSWLLRAALLTASTELDRGRPLPVISVSQELPQGARPPADDAASVENLATMAIDQAARLADRLEELAYTSGADVSWLGLSLSGSRWVLGRVGPDLCTGTAGIALFFATLADLTADRAHRRLAELSTAAVRAQVDRGDLGEQGGMAGLGGAIYTFVRLARLLDDDRLLDKAAHLVKPLAAGARTDTSLDVIGGSAGSIAGLLALHSVRPTDEALGAVAVCANRLVDSARHDGTGAGWLPAAFIEDGIADRPLSGFAHGAAGIAWALARAGHVLTVDQYRVAAASGVAYERSLYDETESNWLDLRRDPRDGPAGPPRAFMTAWCHGAGGIGLSRVQLGALLDDADAAAEIDVAVRTVRRSGFGTNHSLCHGDLGNLDLLLQAGAGGTRQELENILASLHRYGPVPGTPRAVETPGLLTGLAGIGYGLLRAARPDAVPSVLTMQVASMPAGATGASRR